MGQTGFETWWPHYPKRPNNPKQAARVVWDRLDKAGTLPPLRDMIAAADRYADYCRREKIEPRFIAHARTWLNQQRWQEFIFVDDAKPQVKSAFPAILSPLVDAIGESECKRQFYDCDLSEDAGTLIVRTPWRFQVAKLEVFSETVSRIIKAPLRIELKTQVGGIPA